MPSSREDRTLDSVGIRPRLPASGLLLLYMGCKASTLRQINQQIIYYLCKKRTKTLKDEAQSITITLFCGFAVTLG